MKRRPIEDRFWERVKKTKTCWIWQGSKMKSGYGVIGNGGRYAGQTSIHRLSYKIHFGEIPLGMCVCHCCDNPACVNPKHLWLGTHQANVKDMVLKGRRKGVKHAMAKMTEKQILEIRKRYIPFAFGCKKLAKIYGLLPQTIHNIITRKTWKHI